MTIGLPRETKNQEHRVGLTPAVVKSLIARGHSVVVEAGAGAQSSYGDDHYRSAGAEIVGNPSDVYARADLIVKVKEPQMDEVPLLREGQILFTYLHLAASRELTQALLESGCTALAYETLEVNGRLPLLEPMSEIAGRMSAIVGSYYLGNHRGGRGILLGGVPGVAPGRVVVVGGGTAGINAARVATGVGADVTILEVDFDRMRFLDITMDGAHTLYSNEANLTELLPRTDLIIGAVLVPGAPAPKLITRDMLKLMPRGAVLVDIAVDQGGCAETTRPTTHDNPTYTEENVLHYCVTNMPGTYARTATQALSNVTQAWITLIADSPSLTHAISSRPQLASAVNLTNHLLTSPPVADSHQLPLTTLEHALNVGPAGFEPATKGL